MCYIGLLPTFRFKYFVRVCTDLSMVLLNNYDCIYSCNMTDLIDNHNYYYNHTFSNLVLMTN